MNHAIPTSANGSERSTGSSVASTDQALLKYVIPESEILVEAGDSLDATALSDASAGSAQASFRCRVRRLAGRLTANARIRTGGGGGLSQDPVVLVGVGWRSAPRSAWIRCRAYSATACGREVAACLGSEAIDSRTLYCRLCLVSGGDVAGLGTERWALSGLAKSGVASS